MFAILFYSVGLVCILEFCVFTAGADINCGVRVIRTNLSESDVAPHKEELAQAMFNHIPVGVGSQGSRPRIAVVHY